MNSLNFYSREHEDFIYKLYRDIGHTNNVEELEEILNDYDPHALKLLLAVSLGYGYQIKKYDAEKEELI